jgi:hypothetical protein
VDHDFSAVDRHIRHGPAVVPIEADSQNYASGEFVGGFLSGGSGIARKTVQNLTQKLDDSLPRWFGGSKRTSPDGCTKSSLAGTDVLMADGTTKDIEDIKIGDKVTATDPETGETGPREVTHLIITEDDKHFNELSIATPEGIENLTATYEHPFGSPSEDRWVDAGDLRPGMTPTKATPSSSPPTAPTPNAPEPTTSPSTTSTRTMCWRARRLSWSITVAAAARTSTPSKITSFLAIREVVPTRMRRSLCLTMA